MFVTRKSYNFLICSVTVNDSHFNLGEAHKIDPVRQIVEVMQLDYEDDNVSICLVC